MRYVEDRPNTVVRIFYIVGMIIIAISLISFAVGFIAAMGSYNFWAAVTALFFTAGTGMITGLGFIAAAQILYFLRKNYEELEEQNRIQRRKD
ncbi:hypothetical protein PsAD2_00304 [Pseudovibrio axinellae]|uniref:Uncharacterized protein n=1 Tax=Pseudovibrio axinellae TaxID=989403 RepID=A0A166B438_9HYPH|nr:hypothetical protein [Pseudovibrio axinellae]KZL21875.1 hypothetical protein PsAD2_00304 [Pseudovibrio axinellae]SEQ81872.1 hypothetical protein SAMN05421798_104302 [Pseudovibrio axinellae]